MKSEILKELESETPNWLHIAKLAKQAYANSNQSNLIGFRKGALNIIKTGEYTCDDIFSELQKCFTDKEEYNFLLVGGYRGMDVNKFNKLIPNLLKNYDDKYIIVVTNKSQVFTNSIKSGLEVNEYKAVIRNKYDKYKDTMLNIEGAGKKITCKFTELKAYVRDLALEEILNK